MALKLIIDSNVINVHGRLQAMNVLEAWQRDGKLVLVGAERLRDETANYPAATAKVESMPNVSEPTVWGISGRERDTGPTGRMVRNLSRSHRRYSRIKSRCRLQTTIKPM